MVALLIGGLFAAMGAFEFKTSFLQSRVFVYLGDKLSYRVRNQPADTVYYPKFGPYNQQQGFSQLGKFSSRLAKQGYLITRQAELSPRLAAYSAWGGNPPYNEKLQSGLAVVDQQGAPLYLSRHPENIYTAFEDIPPLLIDTLLFIENRELLAEDFPRRNPAVEWDRLAEAVFVRVLSLGQTESAKPGASTLATQLEKYRYSPGGVTVNPKEKLRQMVSASVRAYRQGPITAESRQLIVRDYINSTPLSGRPGFGEIHGIGDGLWAWFGIPFERANALLQENPETVDLEEQARIYKAALSLFLSQRRPSYYLLQGQEELSRLTDVYLELLVNNGVVSRDMAEIARRQPLQFRQGIPETPTPEFASRKAVTNVRTELLSMLGVESLYTLDRLDLTVTTTVAPEVQHDVAAILQKLREPDFARQSGLLGKYLLEQNQLDAVSYSVLLYERSDRGNFLRVQTDNLDLPFDMNDGSKLDLGSTAKLRTLITYLDVIETVYRRHAQKTANELRQLLNAAVDPLTSWTLAYLMDHPYAELSNVLEQAMLRTYSASPAERFFTAGGVHHFSNFNKSDNYKVIPVSEALSRSVNLVFIRMMRDIARFYTQEIPFARDIVADARHPLRVEYLKRFADREGSDFIARFYRGYRGLTEEEVLSRLADRTRRTAYRLVMAFRSVKPEAEVAELKSFLQLRMATEMPDDAEIEYLYNKYSMERFNSSDRAYLARVHPLELWLVRYLLKNPEADLSQVLAESEDLRQKAYGWLFKPGKKRAQDKRIRILLEEDAFVAIHRQWQRMGYPFSSLVPSYATALGASADRPSALAELVGILVNDGVRAPMRQIESLAFGENTPYETVFSVEQAKGEKVLSRELCQTVKSAMIAVVEQGTARRLNDVFVDAEGRPLAVGGKTGTGDHRSKQFAPGGRLISEKVVNRNAIFTFFIGDKHFGVILAHVGGQQAQNFEFTSGLAAQILKTLEPALQPLVAPTTEDLMAKSSIAKVAPMIH